MNYVDFAGVGSTQAKLLEGAARGRRWLTQARFAALLEAFDVLLVVGAALAANGLRFGTVDLSGVHGMTVILAALVSFMLFRAAKVHDPAVLDSVFGQTRRALRALVMVFLAMLAIGYATKTSESISRLWAAIWFAGALGAVFASRFAIAHLYRRWRAAGLLRRRVAICGTVRDLDRLERFLERWERSGSPSDQLVGIYLDDPVPLGERLRRWRPWLLGSADDLVRACELGLVDSTLVVVPPRGCGNLEPVVQKLRLVAMDVDLLAGEVDAMWASRPVGKMAGQPVMRIMRRPLDDGQVVLKRAFDIVVSGLALVVLSPLLALIALAVKLDSPGPVLFRQYRHGFNNRPFQVLKFRTMRERPQERGVPQARRNDPRVTRVGAFLRRTSLDELPQLLNVLKGEMSIVGPRPHACEHNDQFAQLIDSYLGRHRIKPGITGWAQVNGYRGETDTLDKMRKRVEHDLHYADNWSIGLDLRIILMTVGCLIHPNAY